MTKLELEAALEARCVAKIDAAGGMALKLQIPGVRGFSDRTALLPGGRIAFFEFKRIKTGRVSAQQHRFQVLLFQLGFNTYFINSDAEFDAALAREMAE